MAQRGRDRTRRASRAATRKAIRQLESTGTVAVGDVSNTLGTSTCWRRSSLRAVVFHELIGWDPAARRRDPGGRGHGAARSRGTRPLPHAHPRGRARAALGLAGAVRGHRRRAAGPRRCTSRSRRRRSGFLASGGRRLARRSSTGAGSAHVAFDARGQSPVAYLDGLGALRPGTGVRALRAGGRRGLRDCCAARGVFVALCPAQQPRRWASARRPCRGLLAAGVRAAASAPTAWPARRRSTCWRRWRSLQAQFPRSRPGRHRAHGDGRRRRGAGPRRPGRDRARQRSAALAFAPAAGEPAGAAAAS